jgi:hypothetical protein
MVYIGFDDIFLDFTNYLKYKSIPFVIFIDSLT